MPLSFSYVSLLPNKQTTRHKKQKVGGGERYEVRARGELQLGVLIESLRREGLEFSVSPPAVVMLADGATGRRLEPFEEVVLEVRAGGLKGS